MEFLWYKYGSIIVAEGNALRAKWLKGTGFARGAQRTGATEYPVSSFPLVGMVHKIESTTESVFCGFATDYNIRGAI